MRRNRLIRAVGLLLGIGLVLGLIVTSEAGNKPANENIVIIQSASPSPWYLSLTPTSLTLCVKGTGTVKAKIVPSYPSDTFTFPKEVKDAEGKVIATVTVVSTVGKGEATVTGTAPGTGTMTVSASSPTSGESFSGSVSVTVFGGKITGPKTTVIYKIGANPTIPLDAAPDQPSGVKYEWSIVTGDDKITFVGDTTKSAVIVRGIAPSAARNDVEVKLKYKLGTKTCEETHKLTVQRPTSLTGSCSTRRWRRKVEGRMRIWAYQTTYRYRVLDQLGRHIKEEGTADLKWDETMVIVSEKYPIRWTFGGADVDRNGRFPDYLWIKFSPYIPTDFLTIILQDITINGWLVRKNTLTYYNDHATAEELMDYVIPDPPD